MFCFRSFLSNTFGKLVAKVNLPMKKQKMNGLEIKFFNDNFGLILLTRRNWSFANLFIKGYWKHAARISSPNTIVEATSRGVVKSLLRNRLNKSSDYVVVRPRYTSQIEEDLVSKKIEGYVGKEYDWSYDGDNDAFYCSELIYVGYLDALRTFPIPPKKKGCQEILHPDELADDKYFISFGTKKQIRG